MLLQSPRDIEDPGSEARETSKILLQSPRDIEDPGSEARETSKIQVQRLARHRRSCSRARETSKIQVQRPARHRRSRFRGSRDIEDSAPEPARHRRSTLFYSSILRDSRTRAMVGSHAHFWKGSRDIEGSGMMGSRDIQHLSSTDRETAFTSRNRSHTHHQTFLRLTYTFMMEIGL